MGTPPPGRAGAGVPRAVADVHDTDEIALVEEIDDGDVQEVIEVPEIDSGDVTGATRVCSECTGEVLTIGVTPPPTLEQLREMPIYWERCTVSGPPALPAWWFCSPKGQRRKKPGQHDGILGVTGHSRTFVKRHPTLI